MIKRPANLNSLDHVICFTSSILHLFCFLIIISRAHLSHRLSHLSNITHISRHFISHPLSHHVSLEHAFSHRYHHLTHFFYFTCISINSGNKISTRTSYRHPLFSSSHAMISTLHLHHHHTFQPFIIHLSACHVVFLHLTPSTNQHFRTKISLQ